MKKVLLKILSVLMLAIFLISSTGISVNKTLCNITGKTYFSLLNLTDEQNCHRFMDHECCNTQASCCVNKCDHEKKKCCSSDFYFFQVKTDFKDNSVSKKSKAPITGFIIHFTKHIVSDKFTESLLNDDLSGIPKFQILRLQSFYRLLQTYPEESHS